MTLTFVETSRCSQGAGDYAVRWHSGGFGWWIVEAFAGELRIAEFVGDETQFPALKAKAREACQVHAQERAA